MRPSSSSYRGYVSLQSKSPLRQQSALPPGTAIRSLRCALRLAQPLAENFTINPSDSLPFPFVR